MINLIVKSYFSLFLSVGFASLSIFLIGLYWILKRSIFQAPSSTIIPKEPSVISDMTAIAGDDILTSQLDLARAYIETNKKQAAKTILEMILAEGNQTQQREARLLLGMI